jgi:hypothetical protein
MKELLMMNDTVMKHYPVFVNLARAEKRFGYFTLSKLSEHYTVCLKNLIWRIELLARVFGPPRSPDIKTPVIFICGENSKVLCMPTIHTTWRL